MLTWRGVMFRLCMAYPPHQAYPPPPLYGVSTTVVRIGSLACFFFVSSATKRSVWPSVMIPLYSRVTEAKVSKCKQS